MRNGRQRSEYQMEKDTSILEKLVHDLEKTVQNTKYFKLLFHVIWFAMNEIAFRGHDVKPDSKTQATGQRL